MRLTGAAVVGCVVAVAGFSGVADAQLQLQAPTKDPRLMGSEIDARAVAEMVAARKQAEERERWLAGSKARGERLRSRTQFRGRLGAEARRIAREKFAPMVVGPLWEPPELASNERKVAMNSDNVMRVERDGKPAGVVDSSVPLRVTAADGSKVPTDMSLKEQPDGFAPVAPVSPTVIGDRVGQGIRFEDRGLAVTPVMSNPDTPGVVQDDRVFYADAAVDTDVIIGAAPSGAAIYYQLRSPASPDALDLDLALPAGAQLRAAPDGLGGVEAVRDGEVIARVAPPMALDAQGTDVPARYEIHGDRIATHVDHRTGDYAYPVMLDPVVDAQLWAWAMPVQNWYFGSNAPDRFIPFTSSGWGGGLYVRSGDSFNYNDGYYGDWSYYPPGTTGWIWRATIGLERQVTTSIYQPVCSIIGLVNVGIGWDASAPWSNHPEGGSGAGPRIRCNTFDHYSNNGSTLFCIQPSCGLPASWPNSAVYFFQHMSGSDFRYGHNYSYIGSSEIWMSDSEAPWITGGPATTVTNSTDTFTVHSHDPGLGVKVITIDSPGNPSWNGTYGPVTLNCAGTRFKPCPANTGTPIAYGNLPPGRQHIRVQVADAGGKNMSPAIFTVDVYDYWASRKYGGADGLNTPSEFTAYDEALASATSGDAYDAIVAGTAPSDRAAYDAWFEAQDFGWGTTDYSLDPGEDAIAWDGDDGLDDESGPPTAHA